MGTPRPQTQSPIGTSSSLTENIGRLTQKSTPTPNIPFQAKLHTRHSRPHRILELGILKNRVRDRETGNDKLTGLDGTGITRSLFHHGIFKKPGKRPGNRETGQGPGPVPSSTEYPS